MLRTLRPAPFFVFATWVAACSTEPAAPPIHDAPVFIAEEAELARRFAPDAAGLGWVTPPIDVHPGSDRLGYRFDAAGTRGSEVRTSTDRGRTWSAWQDATLTFEEEIARNAHADLPPGTTHGQIRFRVAGPEAVTFLAVESFRLHPELRAETAEPGVMLQPLVVDSGVVKRAEWGARAVSCSGSHTPNRMTVHHTDTPTNDSLTVPARVRQIQSFHIDTRQWCDIGYHFLAGQDGKIYQGRVESLIGAHVTSNNTGNMGISFIGAYSAAGPSEAMMKEAARIMKVASQEYAIALNTANVKGHRDYGGGTECPGDALYGRLPELIELAKNGGQPAVGTVRGYVFWGTDFSNDLNDPARRLAGATVQLSSGASVKTLSDGSYAFSNLAPATYQITVSASGFASKTVTRQVTSGATTWASVMLDPPSTGPLVLTISSPTDGQVVTASPLQVVGSWSGGTPASVKVSGEPATLSGNEFRASLSLFGTSHTITAVAYSGTGTELARRSVQITYEPPDSNPGGGGSGGGSGSGGCGGDLPLPRSPWIPPGGEQAAVIVFGLFAALWPRSGRR